MSTTYTQAKSLLDDLKGAKGSVSWQVGKIGNALLEQAQRENPENAVLAAIDPFQPGAGNSYIGGANADDVRAVIGQIVTATRPSLGIA